MDPQSELTMLETAYANFLNGGAVQSYTLNGRSLTRVDMQWMVTRMDTLRVVIARQTQGGASVSQFRPPE
jgi:hypothetical protein